MAGKIPREFIDELLQRTDIVTLIRTLCHQRQTAALIVTHNLELANQLDRHERLADGRLV
jgi:ABC-type lipoprotein export system ATPase subunit